MRALLLPLLAAVSLMTSQAADHHKHVAQKQASASQPQGQATFDTSSLEKAIRESIKQASEKPDPSAGEKADIDRKLAKYTGELSDYTLALAVVTVVLAGIAVWQGFQLKRTVDVAVAEAQPVLTPFVTDMANLHMVIKPGAGVEWNGVEEHLSRILFAFENYGKTPALVRQVRADLFVTEKDQIPRVVFEALPVIFYQEIVPGETGHEEIKGPHAELIKKFRFTSKEIAEINHAAEGDFRRFFLVGQVIYDDYFGQRHTRRFCVKLRLWIDRDGIQGRTFQAQHGGIAYNSATRKKAPKKNDPLDEESPA